DYAEGLARQRLFAMPQARAALEKAIALEPGFPQAHSALAEALDYLGHEARAKEEAKKAFDLAGKLPEDERLRVEGEYYAITASWGRAVEAYRRLFAASPDNVEWGIRLASAQFAAGDDAAGHASVAQVQALPRYEDDPRVYLVLQQAALMRQSYAAVLENAAKLESGGRARGALSLVAEAKQAQAVALWFKGDTAGAIAAADAAKKLAFTVGDRDGVSAAMATRGFVLTEI